VWSILDVEQLVDSIQFTLENVFMLRVLVISTPITNG
jgi:hypothetical protein